MHGLERSALASSAAPVAAPAPALITVKRLVKVPYVSCTVMFPREEERPDKVVKLYAGTKIRQALIMNGIQMEGCNDDLQCLVKCGCVVRNGRALLDPYETQEAQMLNNKRMSEPNMRLTCRMFINKDLEGQDKTMCIRIRPDLENIMKPRDPNSWRT